MIIKKKKVRERESGRPFNHNAAQNISPNGIVLATPGTAVHYKKGSMR